MSFFTPKDKKEAKILAYLRKQDHFFHFNSWPLMIQRIAVKHRITHQERSIYAYFLLTNGLNPSIIITFMQYGRDKFDSSALSQINHIVKNYHSFPYPYYSMFDHFIRR